MGWQHEPGHDAAAGKHFLDYDLVMLNLEFKNRQVNLQLSISLINNSSAFKSLQNLLSKFHLQFSTWQI